MPSRREGENLEHLCYVVLASSIHDICVKLDEREDNSHVFDSLSNLISQLPSIINEKVIIQVIDKIHETIHRTRSTKGIISCLKVILLPKLQKLDLSGLFFKMRISGNINTSIRNVVNSKVINMTNLKSFTLVSKCSDEILVCISEHCKQIEEIVVTLSDLVTDMGIIKVADKCKKLEKLGIYKCWEVTTEGIAKALQLADNLKEMHCDQLGFVLISNFKNTDKKFFLRHFEQTQNLFEPTLEEIKWVGKSCLQLESAQIYVDDSTLEMIHLLGKLKSLSVETSALGNGFLSAINSIGYNLNTLTLSCDSLTQEQLTIVGEICISLSTLHITTATIENDENLRNNGTSFSSLRNLYLQVWKESVLNVECVDFFLLWCKNLNSIVVKAQIEFFNDNYLIGLLECNPLLQANKIILASDKYVPLTLTSVHRLIGSCPNLEFLGISSWDISEEEFLDIRKTMKDNNYNFTVL